MPSEDIAISVRNLTKTYRLFGHPGDRIKQFLSLGFKHYHREFTALKDVSFDIKKGETIGIIGRNGSGKSTLLQLICGILKPTSGTVQAYGRISALLELGAGFNPEFTGRENIFFQGTLMGFPREEIARRFNDIADFADIGNFIDQPVRTYSSGMFVRLAFSVAIYVEPDILIVDEALAVGDLAFQRKCFDQIHQMIARHSCTVILVSHDIRLVERFCSRALLLEHGQVSANEHPREVCQKYYEKLNKSDQQQLYLQANETARLNGSGEAELVSVQILDYASRQVHEIRSGDPLFICIRFRLQHPLHQPEFIIGTQTSDLIYLSSSSTAQFEQRPDYSAGEHEIKYTLAEFPLAPGSYSVRFGIRDDNYRLILAGEGLKSFTVQADPDEAKRPNRLLNLKAEWHLEGQRFISN